MSDYIIKSETLYRVEIHSHPVHGKWEAQGHPYLTEAEAETARKELHARYGKTRIVQVTHTEKVLITWG